MNKYESIELQINTSPDFPKKFGKKVKAAGGSYREARGYSDRRCVFIPFGHEDLAKQIMEEFASKRGSGIILRGGPLDGRMEHAADGKEFATQMTKLCSRVPIEKIARYRDTVVSSKIKICSLRRAIYRAEIKERAMEVYVHYAIEPVWRPELGNQEIHKELLKEAADHTAELAAALDREEEVMLNSQAWLDEIYEMFAPQVAPARAID